MFFLYPINFPSLQPAFVFKSKRNLKHDSITKQNERCVASGKVELVHAMFTFSTEKANSSGS